MGEGAEIGTRVLVVEDERSTRRLLRAFLDGLPGVILCPEEPVNGAEALRIARAWEPDLVLLDLVMPEWSGLYFLEELERDPLPRRPRIIVLSRVSSEWMVEQVLALGADFFLRKPANLTELGRLVGMLSRRSPHEEGQARGQAERLLREMGAQEEWMGFRWAALAVEALVGHIGERLMKEVYYPAIRESGGSYDSVDKNIRDLVAQLHAVSTPAYERLMGGKPARRPSNGTFLRCLAGEVERRIGWKRT